MTNTLHYLTAINLDQPMLVLTAVCIVALIMKRLARFELDGQVQIATYLFWGISLQLVTVPKVMLTLLGGDTSPSAAHLVISSIVMVLVIFILSKALTLFSNRKFSAYFFKNLVRQLTIKSWRVWALGGVFWLLTLVSMSKLWNFDINMTQWLFLHREPAIIVNVLIVLAVFGVLYAFINRFWIATTLTFSAYVVWLIASFVKIADRAEPILPVDTLFLITAPEELTSMVSTPLLIAGVIGIVLLVFLGIFFQKKDRGLKNNGWLHRLIILVFSAGLLGSFTVANQASLPVHSFLLNQVGDRPYFYSQLRGAKLNGTLLQFANNIDVTTMKKPAGYSKAKIEAVEKKYQKAAAKLNKTRSNSNLADQTVIFVLSESFADPTTTPNLKVNKDPIPYIHSLENSTTSGKMLSSGYGGGTANMEYQTLTGLAINNFSPTLPTPYSQLVPYQDQAVAFTDLFDYKVGIHPFSANLYSRKKVYEKFGFDQFYHLKGGDELSFTEKIQDSPYISDESAYNQTVQVINQHAGGQFINLVTMQNHMPYDDYYQYDDFSVSGTAYTDDAHKKQIENYIQGLHYTDQALKKFITELDSIDKPITMVWYGDHYPGIYDGNSMDQVGIQMHATDYFIYSNKKARKNSETLDKTKLVSPNNFSAMALAQMDQQVSPYYALLTKVYENLPAMSLDSMGTNTNNTVNSSSEFVNESGKVVKLNKKQRQLLADYKLIQYDLTAGKNYAINASFMPESSSQKE
jgi:phosphoglycerol transferase MdoB-like AlkP superfamily enzyme